MRKILLALSILAACDAADPTTPSEPVECVPDELEPQRVATPEPQPATDCRDAFACARSDCMTAFFDGAATASEARACADTCTPSDPQSAQRWGFFLNAAEESCAGLVGEELAACAWDAWHPELGSGQAGEYLLTCMLSGAREVQ